MILRHIERLAADFHAIKRRIDSHLVTFEGIIEGTEYLQQLLSLSDAEFRESDQARGTTKSGATLILC